MKQVIFTADDFGLSPAVNAGIERAHRDGVLNSTSLMVSAAAAADAVAIAHRNPTLKVGLHLVVVDGHPMLPPREVRALLTPEDKFSTDLVHNGFRYFFLPAARRALAREIRAQFDAFKATGLKLDHVDSHHHFHLHPTVLRLLLEIGQDYGLQALRVPAEPPLLALLAGESGALQRRLQAVLLRPWTQHIRRRIRALGITTTDCVVGLHDTGRMTIERLAHILRVLPEQSVEIFFHPAVGDAAGPWPLPIAACAQELAALLSPAIGALLIEETVQRVSFSELAAARRG